MCLSEILVIIRSVFVRCLLIIVKELNFVRELVVVRNLLGVGCLIIVGDDVIIQMLLGKERTRPPKERRHSFVCRPSSRALGESTSLRSGSGPTAALESQSGATRPKCSAQNAAVHWSRPTTSVIWPPTSTPLCRISLGSHLPRGARYTTRLSRHCRPVAAKKVVSPAWIAILSDDTGRAFVGRGTTTPLLASPSRAGPIGWVAPWRRKEGRSTDRREETAHGARRKTMTMAPPVRSLLFCGGIKNTLTDRGGVGKKGGRPTAGRRRRTSKNDDDVAAPPLALVLWGDQKYMRSAPPSFLRPNICKLSKY